MIVETLAELQKLKDSPHRFCRVEDAFDSDPLNNLADVPAAYVYPFQFTGMGRASDNRIDQREDQFLGIQLVCATSDFERCRRAVNTILMGYQYTSTATMFEFDRAEFAGLRSHIIWFNLIYRTTAPVGT